MAVASPKVAWLPKAWGDHGGKVFSPAVLESARPSEAKLKQIVGTATGTLVVAAWATFTSISSRQRSKKHESCISLQAYENELGVQAPVGFWDPLGLTKDGDASAFRRRRETELKHGRVAMIACIGYITPEFARFPGSCSPSAKLDFSEIPNGLAAFNAVPSFGWVQMILFVLALEKGFLKQDPDRAPGDFENAGVLGVPNRSTMPRGEARNKRLNAELANGRLAMMAIIGMFYQDGLTGSAWGDWSNYTDSPLRAIEGELAIEGEIAIEGDIQTFFDITKQCGVTAPAGEPGVAIWDPAGLSKNIDSATFRQYRSAELKHGRICMLAVLGLIVQHWWKLPKLADAPSGISAAQAGQPSAPLLGVLFICVGIIEFNTSDEDREPGDFGDPFDLIPLADYNPENSDDMTLWRDRELNHCRLAMVAFLGAAMAEYATGFDVIQQWKFAGPAFRRTVDILSFPESKVLSLDSYI